MDSVILSSRVSVKAKSLVTPKQEFIVEEVGKTEETKKGSFILEKELQALGLEYDNSQDNDREIFNDSILSAEPIVLS